MPGIRTSVLLICVLMELIRFAGKVQNQTPDLQLGRDRPLENITIAFFLIFFLHFSWVVGVISEDFL